MDLNYLKIIEHYGVNHQLKHFQTEVFELNEAIFNHQWLKSERGMQNIDHIAEELADCYVMLAQFAEYYQIHSMKIAEIMAQKIDRQLERIKKENE